MRLKLAPTVGETVALCLFAIALAGILGAFIARKGGFGFSEFFLTLLFASPWLCLKLRIQRLTLDGATITIRRGGFSETFDLAAIRDIRVETKVTRFEKFTIALQHTWQTVRFGKDLTPDEAQWLVEFLKSRIAAQSPPSGPTAVRSVA